MINLGSYSNNSIHIKDLYEHLRYRAGVILAPHNQGKTTKSFQLIRLIRNYVETTAEPIDLLPDDENGLDIAKNRDMAVLDSLGFMIALGGGSDALFKHLYSAVQYVEKHNHAFLVALAFRSIGIDPKMYDTFEFDGSDDKKKRTTVRGVLRHFMEGLDTKSLTYSELNQVGSFISHMIRHGSKLTHTSLRKTYYKDLNSVKLKKVHLDFLTERTSPSGNKVVSPSATDPKQIEFLSHEGVLVSMKVDVKHGLALMGTFSPVRVSVLHEGSISPDIETFSGGAQEKGLPPGLLREMRGINDVVAKLRSCILVEIRNDYGEAGSKLAAESGISISWNEDEYSATVRIRHYPITQTHLDEGGTFASTSYTMQLEDIKNEYNGL